MDADEFVKALYEICKIDDTFEYAELHVKVKDQILPINDLIVEDDMLIIDINECNERI